MANEKAIAIACDHGGYRTKQLILKLLADKGIDVEDLGTHSGDSVDYPDYGHEVAKKISDGTSEKAILICGTGIGMSITANRYPSVRAALVNDVYSAKMSRLHNDANVLVIGGRVVGDSLVEEIVTTWLDTGFEGGRHARRIDKIDKDRVETVVHKVVSRYLDRIGEVDHDALEKMIDEALNELLKNSGKK